MSAEPAQPECPRHGGKIGILPPASAGSLGDQAMIDAAAGYIVDQLHRPVLIGPNFMHVRSKAELPKGTGARAVLPIMARMMLTCRSMGCIGADVLDGVYNPDQVIKRVRFLSIAHRLGRTARVFGASWSETPSDIIIALLRKSPWLQLCARDPISQARMEKTLGREVRLVADLAFLMQSGLTTPAAMRARDWVQERRRAGRVVMGVNLSGHTLAKLPGDGVQVLAAPIIRWLAADAARDVLLMPHDRRGNVVGDGGVLGRLREILSDRFADRLHALPVELEAWDLKALAGEVDLVLTGRMHLAIAAMGMGTPAICTVYQGKFEGLMAHFGLEGMTVAPADMDSAACDAQLARVTESRAAISGQIQARLPYILDLSRRNFAGM